MARIPDEVIERLKQEVSLERLAEAHGVKLKRHGADLLGLCPFHDDHEPSLVISPKKNLWHCLGACQTGGTVIDWVMKTQGVSFRHAVELLRADHPSLAAPTQPVRQSTVRKLAPPIDRDGDDALTFWCAGYRNVIASYGVNGFTEDHKTALQKHGTKRVLIAYDRDEAGEKAALALADELMAMGIECFRVLFPKGMDANEYALKARPPAKSLAVMLNKAQWLGKGTPPDREIAMLYLRTESFTDRPGI